MQDNRKYQVVQKADMALGDLAPGGLFLAKQAVKFFRVMVKSNVMTNLVRSVIMDRNQEEFPRLLWTQRVLYPGVSGSAVASAQRSKPVMSKVTLQAHLFRGQVVMPEEMLEDQIEKQTFKSTIQQMAQVQIGGDTEDILLRGDTTSADPTLAALDGLLKQVTTYTVAAGVVTLDKSILRDIMDTKPSERRAKEDAFFTSDQAISDYEETLENRATGLGDSSITTGASSQSPVGGDTGLRYRRRGLFEVPRFPTNLGAGTNETNTLYGNPRNCLLGFQRRLKVAVVYRPESGSYDFLFNVRIGIQQEYEPLWVRADGILST